MGYLKALFLLLGFLLFGVFGFLIALPVSVASVFVPSLRYELNSVFITPFSFFARMLLPVKLVIENKERALLARPAVFIGNHQTGLDFALISQSCARRLVIVAKKELYRIPVFGWFFKLAGNLLIDRSDKKSSMEALKGVIEIVREQNLNVAIFPEGTRSKTGEFLPFKKGAFILAKELSVPIIPVVCSRLSGIAIWERFELGGGEVRLSVLPPVRLDEVPLDQMQGVIDQIRAEMMKEYARLNLLLTGKP